MKLFDLRNAIAIVPQDCVLFNDTILYNIAYGGIKDDEIQKAIDDKCKDEWLRDKIVPAAQKSQIHDFIMQRSK